MSELVFLCLESWILQSLPVINCTAQLQTHVPTQLQTSSPRSDAPRGSATSTPSARSRRTSGGRARTSRGCTPHVPRAPARVTTRTSRSAQHRTRRTPERILRPAVHGTRREMKLHVNRCHVATFLSNAPSYVRWQLKMHNIFGEYWTFDVGARSRAYSCTGRRENGPYKSRRGRDEVAATAGGNEGGGNQACRSQHVSSANVRGQLCSLLGDRLGSEILEYPKPCQFSTPYVTQEIVRVSGLGNSDKVLSFSKALLHTLADRFDLGGARFCDVDLPRDFRDLSLRFRFQI